MTVVSRYENALRTLAEIDPRLVVMTAENRAAIRGLPEALGPRFIDVGICEQTMVGMAAGLALRGRIPVVHALASFLTLRAFEFIRTDVGIANLPVKLVGGVPGVLSEANGPTHQAIDDVAVMRAIPGMNVFCPADEAELCAGLPAVLAAPGPAYIRYNARPSQVAHGSFRLGRAELLGDGTDVALVAAGFLVPNAAAACAALRDRGVGARLVNLRTLAPVDEEAIVAAARACPLLVTLEDHLLVGGTYALVCEILVRHRVSVPVLPIGFNGRWFRPGLLAAVLEHEGLTVEHLTARVIAALAEHTPHRATAAPARNHHA
jgi:transketolase